MTIPTPRDTVFDVKVESNHALDYPFAFLVRTDGTTRVVADGRMSDALTLHQKRALVAALRTAASTIEDSFTPRLVDN